MKPVHHVAAKQHAPTHRGADPAPRARVAQAIGGSVVNKNFLTVL
jgi:hypothetical protein